MFCSFRDKCMWFAIACARVFWTPAYILSRAIAIKRVCTMRISRLSTIERYKQLAKIFDGGQPVHCCLTWSRTSHMYDLECQLKSRQLLGRCPPLWRDKWVSWVTYMWHQMDMFLLVCLEWDTFNICIFISFTRNISLNLWIFCNIVWLFNSGCNAAVRR